MSLRWIPGLYPEWAIEFKGNDMDSPVAQAVHVDGTILSGDEAQALKDKILATEQKRSIEIVPALPKEALPLVFIPLSEIHMDAEVVFDEAKAPIGIAYPKPLNFAVVDDKIVGDFSHVADASKRAEYEQIVLDAQK